jgi:hypothetical protein
MTAKNLFFCLLLVLLWVPSLSVLVQFSDIFGLADFNLGTVFAVTIARSAPLIAKDASLFGELTPVAVAAGLTMLAPNKGEAKLIYISVALCALGWIQYLALSVLTDQQTPPEHNTQFFTAIQTIIESEVGPSGMVAFKGFVTGTRVFYLVIGASLFGIRLRSESA